MQAETSDGKQLIITTGYDASPHRVLELLYQNPQLFDFSITIRPPLSVLSPPPSVIRTPPFAITFVKKRYRLRQIVLQILRPQRSIVCE